MGHYVFTEDTNGKHGYVGVKESEVAANDLAEDYLGITYVVKANDLVTAKRRLRDHIIRRTGNLGEGYKNVKNESTLEEI